MKIIITTVGTSLFENYMREEVEKDLFVINVQDYQGIKDHYKRLRDNTLSANEYNENNTDTKYIKKTISEFWLNGITKKDKKWTFEEDTLNEYACAEIESILAIIAENPSDSFNIYLLATDTVLSFLASTIIKEILPSFRDSIKSVSIEVIIGLQVDNPDDFETKGFINLTNHIKDIQENQEKNKNEILLNITGGYKGTIPILTLLGQLLSIDIKYLYENSNNLITIPKLPIQFDLSFIESFASHLSDENLSNIDDELYQILDNYKLVKSDKTMSGLGRVLHKYLFSDKVSLSNITLGKVMEYKLFHHFSTENSQGYEKPIMNNEAKHFSYKIEDGKYFFSDRQNEETNQDKAKELGYTDSLGDIDILLKDKSHKFVIGEVKAHNTFGKLEKKYYKKIKARIEYCKQILGEYPSEYLFIVFKIKVLQGDRNEFQTNSFKNVYNQFKKDLENDYKDNDIKFKVLGLWINPPDNELVNYQKILDSELIDKYWDIFTEELT